MTAQSMQLPALLSEEVAADPHAFYRLLRERDPVHYDSGVDAYVVSRFEDCAHVYRDPAFSTNAYAWQLEPVHGRTILQLDGTEHARRRALVSPQFRGSALDQLIPTITRIAASLVEEIALRNATELAELLAGRGEADFVAEFANHYPLRVMADMLGLPAEEHERFFGWYSSIIDFVSNLARDPVVAAAGMATKRELRAYFLPLIDARRESPGEDLISSLATVEIDGERMENEEIVSYLSLLLTAGAETTDKAVGSLFKNLLENPEQLAAVRDDRALVAAAVAESIRFSPPSQMNTRELVADAVLAGTPLPQGATVLLAIGSANRDERRFADPDRFDIYRRDLNVARAFTGAADHLSFGSGRHYCLGAVLAKTELQIGLNLMLDRFPQMSLPAGYQPQDVGLKMRGPAQLRVSLGEPAGVP